MDAVHLLVWKKINKETGQVPPFDTLCLVRGKHKEYHYWQYATAYNECWPPLMNMTQRVELSKELQGKLPVYLQVPFEIEEWLELEQ